MERNAGFMGDYENNESGSFEQPDERDLLSTVYEHDRDNARLYEFLAEASNNGAEGIKGNLFSVLNFRANKAVSSWHGILSKLAEDEELDSRNFSTQVATLWMDDERKRAEFLNKLSPTANIEPAADGEIANLRAEIEGALKNVLFSYHDDDNDKEKVCLTTLANMYGTCMARDLEMFVQCIEDVEYSRVSLDKVDEAEKIKLLRKFGSKILTGVGITASVVAGMVIGSFFRKK